MSLLKYFADPVLRGPMGGTIFLCLTLSLVGIFVFFQKRSLVGEMLSHAAYPGVILGLLFFGCSEMTESVLFFALGACLIALFLMRWLMTKVSQDLALTFTLSAFFGFGILLLSLLQFSCGYLGRLAESFFFGQAATMGDAQVRNYGLLALVVVAFITLFYKELKILLFDETFAKTLGIRSKIFNGILFFFTLVALVAGIRSVGVVLISAILVAPTIAARQLVNKFFHLLWLAPLFGVISAFLGNILSFELSSLYSTEGNRLVIPTGPAIVLVASLIALLSIFFAPKRGIVSIALRLNKFKKKRQLEDVLKYLYRHPDASKLEVENLFSYIPKKTQYILAQPTGYQLTEEGKTVAQNIVRLHRLWEVYLVRFMGKGVQEVHEDAEEMEHILTPEMELKLTKLLDDPKVDPHQQPIPPRGSA